MAFKRRYPSLVLLVLAGIVLFSYRVDTVHEKEISWDVLGYYMHLPATFIYDDPLLNDVSWLEKVNAEKQLTGTLYQVSSNDEGEPMYFFLWGMALFFLPFFLIGHGFACLTGYPPDGFSLPYQYAMVIGCMVYTLIGLIYLRKILLYYFSEGITTLVLVLVIAGTNYVHHLSIKNLETVNVLFMLVSIILWFTIRWHDQPKLRNLLPIGACIALMALVKPSEVVILLLPLLWQVSSKDSFFRKLTLLQNHRRDLFLTVLLAFLIALPQMVYWTLKTGFPIYDSYKNPGVGLDIFSPHILEVLFSYRKGWLVYTPIMVLFIAGLYWVYRQKREHFFALIAYIGTEFYIVASWSEWWYGAGFSNRPMITVYPLLAIGLGFLLTKARKWSLGVRLGLTLFVVSAIFLNQFQWWQLKNYILDPYRTTKAYYWATFLKTDVTEEDRELLLIERSFTGPQTFDNREKYQQVQQITEAFEEADESVLETEGLNSYLRLLPEEEYSPEIAMPFYQLTDQDHVWIEVSVRVRFPEGIEGPMPCLVMTMQRLFGSYGYLAPELGHDLEPGIWKEYRFEYLTPEIRSSTDRFKCYLWKRSASPIEIDDLEIKVFEKRINYSKAG